MPIAPRDVIRELKAYPAPSEGRYDKVRLDFNENTTGFPNSYPGQIGPARISAYPEYGTFIAKLSASYSVDAESLLITNGSDEAIALIAQTFVEPGQKAVLSRPCFVVMNHSLKLVGAAISEVDVRQDYSFDIDGITSQLPGARIAMFATPENPTGKTIEPDVIEAWCAKFPQTLFVIDEAYGEYWGKTTLNLVPKFDNLLVLKTFSKAWGMAGLRLGITFGQSSLLDWLRRMKLPFTVNSAAVWTASKLLDSADLVLRNANETMELKRSIENRLREAGFQLVTGEANSFLLRLAEQAAPFERYARERGVLVRGRVDGYVRVSVGTADEMELFFNTLMAFKKDEVTVC